MARPERTSKPAMHPGSRAREQLSLAWQSASRQHQQTATSPRSFFFLTVGPTQSIFNLQPGVHREHGIDLDPNPRKNSRNLLSLTTISSPINTHLSPPFFPFKALKFEPSGLPKFSCQSSSRPPSTLVDSDENRKPHCILLLHSSTLVLTHLPDLFIRF
jgi:hypothetical protein